VNRTARLLLPGRLRDGTLLTWAQAAQRARYSAEVDGYTDWAELAELRERVPADTLPPAAAGVIDVTATRLMAALKGHASRWFWSPDAVWSQESQSAVGGRHGPPMELEELVADWMRQRFSGRAWNASVTIEAPSYADSLLVTAPEEVLARMVQEGLECHPVSKRRHIPIWRD